MLSQKTKKVTPQNKNLITWLLYDTGNSFLEVAKGGLFLAQWIIIDNNFDDIWYGGTFSASTVLVLFLSPIMGAWSDKLKNRLTFVRWLTVFMYIGNLALAFFALSDISPRTRVFLVLAAYLLVQTFYQLSLVVYNALLDGLTTEKNRGRIAGLGEAFDVIGWLAGLIILMQFAKGGREQIFLPALVVFFALTLPMLFLFKENPSETAAAKTPQAKKLKYKYDLSGIKDLFHKDKNVGTFLLGFSFVSDAILTISLYFAVLLDRIYKVDDSQKAVLLVVMYVSQIVSGYLLGRFSDRVGKKKILIFSCLLLAVSFTAGFLGSNIAVMYTIAPLAGIAWGGFYTTSTALMVDLSPKDRLGEYFGLYSTFQRFASIVGPLLWGGVVLALKNHEILKYRFAGLSLILLIIIGTKIFWGVKEKNAFS